ncbi:MAG: hypothetical protein ACLTF6_14530 [Clostridium sp.]
MSAISPSAPAFILLFFLLLFFPEQAIQGASDGLLLWFHTVLPTLAPAMICTRMLLLTGGDRLLIKPLRPLFCRFFALSDTGAFILLSGMICGYPLGPALCAQALEKNRITRKEAAYLLAFCSFPSPMFLAGYIPGQFPGPLPVGLLLFGNLSSGTFAVMDCRTQIFPPQRFQIPRYRKTAHCRKKAKTWTAFSMMCAISWY